MHHHSVVNLYLGHLFGRPINVDQCPLFLSFSIEPTFRTLNVRPPLSCSLFHFHPWWSICSLVLNDGARIERCLDWSVSSSSSSSPSYLYSKMSQWFVAIFLFLLMAYSQPTSSSAIITISHADFPLSNHIFHHIWWAFNAWNEQYLQLCHLLVYYYIFNIYQKNIGQECRVDHNESSIPGGFSIVTPFSLQNFAMHLFKQCPNIFIVKWLSIYYYQFLFFNHKWNIHACIHFHIRTWHQFDDDRCGIEIKCSPSRRPLLW